MEEFSFCAICKFADIARGEDPCKTCRKEDGTKIPSNYEAPESKKLIFADNEPYDLVDDVVNHPKHYCRDDAMECIDEMLLIFGEEAVKHFCLCNAWKYRYRAADKNGEEDLKKSDWYLRKYKELDDNFKKRYLGGA